MGLGDIFGKLFGGVGLVGLVIVSIGSTDLVLGG